MYIFSDVLRCHVCAWHYIILLHWLKVPARFYLHHIRARRLNKTKQMVCRHCRHTRQIKTYLMILTVRIYTIQVNNKKRQKRCSRSGFWLIWNAIEIRIFELDLNWFNWEFLIWILSFSPFSHRTLHSEKWQRI